MSHRRVRAMSETPRVTRRTRFFLLLLLVVAALVCVEVKTRWKPLPRGWPATRAQIIAAEEGSSPAAVHLPRSLAEQRAFDADQKHIKPDRRFGLAIEALARIQGTPELGDVVAIFENN